MTFNIAPGFCVSRYTAVPFDNARIRIVGVTHQRYFVIGWFNEFTDTSFNVMDVYRWGYDDRYRGQYSA